MPKTIITAFPKEKRIPSDNNLVLNVAECFSRTVQGEGINTGTPSTFLRLQHCTLSCGFCDTTEVWRQGNPYTISEILDIWEKEGVVEDLQNGHHLVLTGGSPILQEKRLLELLQQFNRKYHFRPYTEIENECTLLPSLVFADYVDCWNNSPKLSNSGMRKEVRYKPSIIQYLSNLRNSWFKFVVSNKEDWNEIQNDFIDKGLIWKKQIILMPEGVTREQLQSKYDFVVNLACRQGVRITDRLHINIWNKTVGA